MSAYTALISVFVFAFSIITFGFRFGETSVLYRECYLRLQKLLDCESNPEKLVCEYHEILGGYRFCRDLIELRSSSLKKMFANLMKSVTGFKYGRQSSGKSLLRLNLRITGCQLEGRRIGWLFFFSQSKNIKQLQHLDTFLAKHAKKVMTPEQASHVKRFVKAYHEIKFNLEETRYIPNFDKFSLDEKKAHIAILRGPKIAAKLDTISEKEVDDLFHESVSYEVAGLEKDMMEVFS